MLNQDFHSQETEHLMKLIEPELETVRDGLDDLHEAYTAAFATATSMSAGLRMLEALADVASASEKARRELAVALSLRGAQTTTIAKSADVSRITVNRWRKTDLQDD